MLLLTDKFIFNLDEILYVTEYDLNLILVKYKNGKEQVFNISYEDFYTALNQNRIR